MNSMSSSPIGTPTPNGLPQSLNCFPNNSVREFCGTSSNAPTSFPEGRVAQWEIGFDQRLAKVGAAVDEEAEEVLRCHAHQPTLCHTVWAMSHCAAPAAQEDHGPQRRVLREEVR